MVCFPDRCWLVYLVEEEWLLWWHTPLDCFISQRFLSELQNRQPGLQPHKLVHNMWKYVLAASVLPVKPTRKVFALLRSGFPAGCILSAWPRVTDLLLPGWRAGSLKWDGQRGKNTGPVPSSSFNDCDHTVVKVQVEQRSARTHTHPLLQPLLNERVRENRAGISFFNALRITLPSQVSSSCLLYGDEEPRILHVLLPELRIHWVNGA